MLRLIKYMVGAASLDGRTYELAEADHALTGAAVLVAGASCLAAAIGAGAREPGALLSGSLTLMLTWVVWVALAYLIGTRLLPEPATHSNMGELIRTTGFSASPGLLRLFALIPADRKSVV